MTEKSTGGESHNNKSIFDSLFKIVVIVLGIVYVALYYDHSLNGRYIVVDKSAFPPTILDTRYGIYYSLDGELHIIADQVKGIIRGEETKKIPKKK